MIRVMHLTNHLGMGGAESLIKEYAMLLDNEKFEIILVMTGQSQNSVNEKKLKELNIRMFFLGDFIPKNGNKYKRLIAKIKQYKLFRKIVKNERPDVIHSHLSTNDFLKYTNTEGIKLFYTIHSEVNSMFKNQGTRLERATKYCIDKKGLTLIALNKKMANDAINKFSTTNVIVLNNGIDMNKFNMQSMDSTQVRKQLNLPSDAFVIGHIGRFMPQKNHNFLIDIFEQVVKKCNNAYLILIGSGEGQEQIKNKVEDLGLSNSVLFLGNRSDIPELLSIMDTFVLPSKVEGFPMVLIEAQTSKVKCVVSSAVSKEVKLTNLVQFIDLNDPIYQWVDKILEEDPYYEEFNLLDYDMKRVIKKLEALYSGNELVKGKS